MLLLALFKFTTGLKPDVRSVTSNTEEERSNTLLFLFNPQDNLYYLVPMLETNRQILLLELF
jgi:hypothetical protein